MPNYRGISDTRPFGPCPALQQAHMLLWLKYGPYLGALDTPQIRFLVRSMALFRIFLYRPRPDGSGGGRASIQENPPGSWVLSGTEPKSPHGANLNRGSSVAFSVLTQLKKRLWSIAQYFLEYFGLR